MQHRAALLASHGFAVLALAYFGYEDLPEGLSDVDLEYFEQAAEWLSKQPNVMSDGVGIIGVSLGADIAVMTASVCPTVIVRVLRPFLTTANSIPLCYYYCRS